MLELTTGMLGVLFCLDYTTWRLWRIRLLLGDKTRAMLESCIWKQSLQPCSLNTTIHKLTIAVNNMTTSQESKGLTLTVLGSGKCALCSFEYAPRSMRQCI
jgi:hypothetical protein